MGIGKSRLLFAGAMSLALLTSGCGRTRSSLLPRIDVAKVIDGKGDPASGVDDEQYVNNQIDAERKQQKPTVAEATDSLLASAESESGSWKDKLLGKKDQAENAAAAFGNDPFLDDLDAMITQETKHVARTVDARAEDFSGDKAAEIFGDFEQQAKETIAAIDQKTQRAEATAADVFDATKEDVFGEFSNPAEAIATNVSERTQALAAEGRRVITEGRGKMVHRFDDLFDSEAQQRTLQRVASETVQREPAPASFDVPQEFAEVQQQPRELIVPDSTEDLAGMFDAPEAPTPASPAAPAFAANEQVEPFDVPTPDMIPGELDPFEETLEPLEAPETVVAQQDAVVTPNQPAAIPSLPIQPRQPQVPSVPDFGETDFGESDFAKMDRIEANPYEDPSFTDTADQQLPPVNDFPPVTIPAEPAPRFAAATPTPQMPAQPPIAAPASMPVQAPTMPVSSSVVQTQQPPAVAAAVLPNVNWQATPVVAPAGSFRAPSEWTAWFLMGGAGLIILLLFAPSRRQ
ncbi:MAG: hypothetical protein AB8G99_05410 [Planctomycetaceae bacterium]